MSARFIVADVFDGLATIEDGSVDLVVTSPPFLALRSYLPADHPDKGKEIGQEATPAEFIDTLLAVTAELRRVLAPHGSIAIELGDTYAGSGGGGGDYYEGGLREGQPGFTGSANANREAIKSANAAHWRQKNQNPNAWPLAKSKALIPELYRVALAYGINPLTGAESPAGRWRIRNVVTWCRPNPPVGALGDKWRPATSDIVIACTSDKRYWDDIATRRPLDSPPKTMRVGEAAPPLMPFDADAGNPDKERLSHSPAGAPLLDWWELPPGGYPGSHYAVYPPALVEPLIKAMAPPKVCRTCGEPVRRIMDHPGIDRRPGGGPDPTELAAYLKANLNGYTPKTLAAALSLPETQVSHYLRTDEAGARLPDADTWDRLKELLNLDNTFDAAMAIVAAEYENIDYGNREIPERLSGGTDHPKRIPVGWTDCGHDDWRPAVILDPFAGSGTTLAVATGHGHDAIGIDIDERNYQLALERVGPMLLGPPERVEGHLR